MKTTLAATCVVISTLLVPAAAVAADADKSRASPKELMKDSVITTKVKAAMAKDKDVSALNIKVDTDNSGIVQLSGTAKTKAEAEKAVTIARGVEGVTSVKNDIRVQTN